MPHSGVLSAGAAAQIKRYRKRGQYMDEMVIWVYFLEVCEGLKALHDRDIIHRGASSEASLFFQCRVGEGGHELAGIRS